MSTKTVDEIIELIQAGDFFDGYVADASFYIKISDYQPYICTAIHNGHSLRNELYEICNLSDKDRYHEEDPFTGDMISPAPIILIANDSRYEYDLNRSPDSCIHTNIWGREVWTRALTAEEIATSRYKHEQFYKVCNALVQKLLSDFPACIVFDIHSYNISDRDYINPPMFNIGTNFVNKSKFDSLVQAWVSSLATIQIPSVVVEAKENDVFFGKGYLAEFMSQRYTNCLVLPTEVKKIYTNEFKAEPDLDMIARIRDGFELKMGELILELAKI